MQNQLEREVLKRLLTKVRQRILVKTSVAWFIRIGSFTFPIAALAIAADQRWNQGHASLAVTLVTLFATIATAILLGLYRLGARVESALTLDEHAHLKDRVSSAWEFLEQSNLDEARQVQIRDAIQHAEALNYSRVLRIQWPRFSAIVPAAALLVALSFLIPAKAPAKTSNTPASLVKQLQLDHLDELQQELQAKENLSEEMEETIKKLGEIRKQFEKGEIGEREVMLELGRLDESLRSKLGQMNFENMEAELSSMLPHLSANALTLSAAQAIKEQKLDQAAKEMKDLGQKVEKNEVSKEDQKKLAAHLGAAAAKLGKKSSSDSFAGDLAQASESLENSNSEGFKTAMKNISDKLGQCSKCQGLKSMCNKIGLCKGGLGQCNSECKGISLGEKMFSKKQGGKGAGTGASGDPFGDAKRLDDGYKKMVQISGQPANGPVESEIEITDGQLSQSQLTVKELHANFAAAAEEVIEKEDIPLSQRYHVKRYFQAIRPQGE